MLTCDICDVGDRTHRLRVGSEAQDDAALDNDSPPQLVGLHRVCIRDDALGPALGIIDLLSDCLMSPADTSVGKSAMIVVLRADL